MLRSVDDRAWSEATNGSEATRAAMSSLNVWILSFTPTGMPAFDIARL